MFDGKIFVIELVFMNLNTDLHTIRMEFSSIGSFYVTILNDWVSQLSLTL